MSNFDVLRNQLPQLAELGAFAESYVYSDPVSAIIKLRIFSEQFVNTIYAKQQFYYESSWSFYDRLENIEFKDNVDKSILQKLHAIRMKGNTAAHKGKASSDDALWLLKEAYLMACWYNALYSKSESQPCKEFVQPAEQGVKIDKLQETIKELEEVIQKEQDKNRTAIHISTQENKEKTLQFKTVNEQIASNMSLSNNEINNRIDIEDIYSEYDLTDEQHQLVQELKLFLSDKTKHLFLLKGYAGTGKTFILKGLTDYFELTGRNYRLAAPTGKAARVIASKTRKEAYTIHKSIYSNTDIKEFKTENTDGTETYKFYYDINVNEDPAQTVYVFDEASMIPDVYSEAEFFRFGSGFLLRDLLKYINLDNNDHDKKIIFVGDNAQLPPVGMKFSPALSEEYLLEKHQLKAASFELTEVVRQANNSGILENAMQLRSNLKNDVRNQLDFNMDYDDVEHIEHVNLMNKYLESCDNKINGESIIIAHSNASVSEYNRRVREHFFVGQPFLAPGDKVMSVSNNVQHEILISNGDFGLVKEVAPLAETRLVRIKRKSEVTGEVENIDITLVFRDAIVGFNDTDNKAHFFQCKIIENLLYSEQPNLSSDEHKALYVDFRMRLPYLRPSTKEFKDALRSDPYFNPMRVKFGYAITCHKAQGSEWNNVFVNCQTNMGFLNATYYRWLYTAITRTSKKLYLLDEPHIKLTSGMKAVGGIFEEAVREADDITLSVESKDDASQKELFGIQAGNSFLMTIFNYVSSAITPEHINILDIQHHPYQEAYFLSDEKERARINIYYTSKQEISNIIWQEKNDLSEKLVGLLASLHHKKIIIKQTHNQDTVEKHFEFSEPFLEEFYMLLCGVLEAHNIKIDDISSHLWLEKYMFSRGDEIASFNFHYNGKKQFTRFMEEKKNSTSVALIRDLNQIFSSELG